MASPKVKNCFSLHSFPEDKFNEIEQAAQALAGAKQPTNAHYASAVSSILTQKRSLLDTLLARLEPTAQPKPGRLTTAEKWGNLRADLPADVRESVPEYDNLPKQQQAAAAEFHNDGNLDAAAMQRVGSMKAGVNTYRSSSSATSGTTIEEINKALDKWVPSSLRHRLNIVVVDKVGWAARFPSAVENHGVTLPSGQIIINAGTAADTFDAVVTVFHELFHRGLKRAFGSNAAYVKAMLDLSANNPAIADAAEAWRNTEGGRQQLADFREAGGDYRAMMANYNALSVEEALGEVAETLRGKREVGSAPMPKLVRSAARILANLADLLNLRSLAQAIRSMTYTELERFVSNVVDDSAGAVTEGTTAQYATGISPDVYRSPEEEAFIKAAEAEYIANPPLSAPPQIMNRMVRALPEAWRPSAFRVAQVLTGKAGDAINTMAFTEDLINRAKGLGMKTADAYRKFVRQQAAVMGGHERIVQNIAGQYMDIEEEHKGLGEGTANQFLHDSTMQRKWGYDVTVTNADGTPRTIQADPAMAKQFKALGPKAQAYVKAVFDYGRDSIKAKQQAVLDSVPSIFDPLIAAESDPKAKQELIDEKASTLKQFGSMYRISGDTPYAPLKRFGKFVVSAKSKSLLALHQKFDTLGDGAEREKTRKLIREMEGDSEHQFVDFVDNEYEARTIEGKLRESGKFDEVQTRSRNEATLYNGSGTLNALRAIEAKLNDDSDGEHKRAMLRMVGNMYLTALSEDSARRSEMERIGVTANTPQGTTRLDMQRAFESQGKADAFFLAHAAVGRGMQDTFKKMQSESNMGGDTRAKSALYNELMARRLQSLNYTDENWSHKAVRMASKWMLAFSPAYYLQNATQPWMVSLPVMAGRHDLGKSAKVLLSTYQNIAAAVKDASLFGNLDYERILSDIKDPGERTFLRRAIEEGIIDIGHGIDLAESSHYDSKMSRGFAKVDRSIRNLQQKAEAINRITTALTAYQLEMEKTSSAEQAQEYAERIVRETHGDYSGWNAPRAFNTDLGRVALQFRKYQLVQLSLMAKMLKTAFADADPKERAMARRAVGLMLGQAFLVGGAKALPMLAVVPAVLAAAFGNGGDEPPEYLFRQWIGNKEISDLLLNGMPSKLTGVNLTNFGGMGNMLSLLPFQDGLLPTDRSSMESFGYAILGGPFGGLTLRAANGASNIANGMWWKGLESFVPTGFTNLSKAVRYGVEGDENKRGTLNMTKDDISGFAIAAQAMGIQPSVVGRRMYEADTKHAIETAFKDDSNRLKAEYVRATREGDSAALSKVRAQWAKMQEGQRADGMPPTPLSTLMKAPQEARKGEMSRHGTQVYAKKEREFGARVAGY